MSQAFNDASNASYASQQGNAMSSQGPQQVPTFPPQPAPYPESPQPYGYGQPRGTWQQPQYAPGFAPYGQGYGMPQYPQQPYPPQQPYEPWPGYGSQPPAGYAEQARPQAQAPAPQPAEQGYVPQPRPYQPQQGYAAQQEYEPRPYGQQAYAPQASYGRPAFEPQPPAAPQQDREPMPDGAAKPPAQQPYEPQRGYVPQPQGAREAPAENGVETKTEPPQPASDGADAEDKSRSRLKYVLIGLGASVAFLVAVGGGMLLMSQVADGAAPANNAAPAKVEAVQSASSGEGSESTPQAETARAEVSASSDEDHKWTDLVQTVHHEAEIEKVHHDAVTQDVTEYHTVCNDCGETVDGVAADHIASTGHSGYTQGVPVTVTKTIAEAFDEEIKKSEPYDEQKVVGRYCADCGTVEMYPEG